MNFHTRLRGSFYVSDSGKKYDGYDTGGKDARYGSLSEDRREVIFTYNILR